MTPTVLTGAAANAVWRHIEDVLKQSAHAIARHVLEGGIAVVVHEPTRPGRTAAITVGWDGRSKCFRMKSAIAKAFAIASEANGDTITATWLRRKSGTRRVFLIYEAGSFLINFDPDVGWSIEPNSTGIWFPEDPATRINETN